MGCRLAGMLVGVIAMAPPAFAQKPAVAPKNVAVHREEIFDRIQREAELAQRSDPTRGGPGKGDTKAEEPDLNSGSRNPPLA